MRRVGWGCIWVRRGRIIGVCVSIGGIQRFWCLVLGAFPVEGVGNDRHWVFCTTPLFFCLVNAEPPQSHGSFFLLCRCHGRTRQTGMTKKRHATCKGLGEKRGSASGGWVTRLEGACRSRRIVLDNTRAGCRGGRAFVGKSIQLGWYSASGYTRRPAKFVHYDKAEWMDDRFQHHLLLGCSRATRVFDSWGVREKKNRYQYGVQAKTYLVLDALPSLEQGV